MMLYFAIAVARAKQICFYNKNSYEIQFVRFLLKESELQYLLYCF